MFVFKNITKLDMGFQAVTYPTANHSPVGQ